MNDILFNSLHTTQLYHFTLDKPDHEDRVKDNEENEAKLNPIKGSKFDKLV